MCGNLCNDFEICIEDIKNRAFYLDKYIYIYILVQVLRQWIRRVNDLWGPNGSQPSEIYYKDQMAKIRKDIVDFHGEMVLIVNYSNINYTGTLFSYLELKPFWNSYWTW